MEYRKLPKGEEQISVIGFGGGIDGAGEKEALETVTAALDAGADIMALFHMTPYAWKTPKEGVARLEALDRLSCEIGFDLHLYQKI